MFVFEKKEYAEKIPTDIECVIGADIGGTNSNIGIFQKKENNLELIFSLHFKSQEITNFTKLTQDILNYVKKEFKITVKHSCFGIAGIISENRDYCKPTNLDIAVDAHDIIKHTDLETAILANDFEILGHGLLVLDPKQIIQVKDGKEKKRSAKAIIGAGTGLGKTILIWDEVCGRYLPMPSEGGHADFSAQNQLELDLIQFIKKTEKRPCNISWEDLLSGSGIGRIYNFFSQRNNKKNMNEELKNNGLHPDKIFSSKDLDEYSNQTYKLFSTLYARCAKNFALDTLALNGLYIAGGIATKNIELFKQMIFLDEFLNCGKMIKILKEIPLYVIADYNVSLYGAAQFMKQQTRNI